MAIEIKELIIKMTVVENQQPKKETASDINQSAKNKIVKECVDLVLQKLQSKFER